MSVADNGCGIPAAEVELAFARHATSKLQDVADLEHITTLGFRGEALASIASVSQVTLVTRAQGEELGSRLRIEGAQLVRNERCGHPQGTTVRAENLFYNVPARLKFLRRDATERKHIDALVTRYAMAYPGLRIALENDGRLSFRSPGSGELLDVLIEVYGLETAQAMIAVDSRASALTSAPGRGSIAVVGYVSQPVLHRGTRAQITLFVNGRWVRDRGLAFAVEQAYHTLLPAKRYPLAVVSVTLPPQEVDVNVHPTKSEVKFRHRDAVFRAVQRSVREALLTQASIPAAGSLVSAGPLAGAGAPTTYLGPAGVIQHGMQFGHHEAGYRTSLGTDGQPWFPETPPDPGKLPPLRVLGQMAQCYIVAEGPEGMYLIDQHAAHERVLYERLLAQQATAAVAVQQLLEPLTVELTPAQSEELQTWLEPLRKLGFEVEPFGGHTVLVRAIPTTLGRIDVRQTLTGILDDLSIEQAPLADEIDARVAAAACKRGAVKAGQTLSVEEMRGLVRQLEETTSPRTCPHGRPTMILLGQAWLEREFGRR
jgi:DNA mismatch repair protein MutL